jgi:hypothetical protein
MGILGVVLVMDELPGRSIQSVESLLRANPQLTITIHKKRWNHIVCQTGGLGGTVPIVREGIRLQIESVEPATVRSNPEPLLPVFNQCRDLIVSQSIGILRIVFVHFEAGSIVSTQAIPRAEPHEPSAVLQNAGYGTLGEPMFDRDALEPEASSWAYRWPSIRVRGRLD